EITGLLLAGMFAGHHTSSVTTAWALIELLCNPEALRRATDEIDRVFGGGRAVTHAALRELTYTEHVVNEALRLHPPPLMRVRVGDKIESDFHGLVIGPKEPCRVRYRRRKNRSVSIAAAEALARTANELENAETPVPAETAARAAAAGCPAHAHNGAAAAAAV